MTTRGASAILAICLALATVGVASAGELSPLEQLGKFLFFDNDLSTPPGMSCAACHAPEVGFTGPIAEFNAHGAVYEGAIHGRFGNRKPPAAAYAGDSPTLTYDADEDAWVGGVFWDGRATGWILGDPLAEQAQGPFLNPLEQANPNMKVVINKIALSDYAEQFEAVFGPGSLPPVGLGQRQPAMAVPIGGPAFNYAQAYERMARAISAYEKSAEVNPFSSKFDYYLAGMVDLTDQEALGLQLFVAEDKGNCAACHPAPLFTDFTYDNLGVPKNPENPFYTMPPNWNPAGAYWVDTGLGGFLANTMYASHAADNLGKQKVPTLRNVDKRPYPDFVKAYGHNGYFKSLEEIVHFYNTRDVPGAGWEGEAWPAPEVSDNINSDELGNLGLTPEEEAAIVAFMKTLSDGYEIP